MLNAKLCFYFWILQLEYRNNIFDIFYGYVGICSRVLFYVLAIMVLLNLMVTSADRIFG
jgi:hypothetical protein